MPFRLEARPRPSLAMRFASPVVAALATVLAGIVLFSLLGAPPLLALRAFFIVPLSSVYGLSELLLKASPLVIIAIGLAIGFRANVWNVGAEGQLALGAIGATWVALALHGSDSLLVLPAMIVAGAIGGLAWAAIAAVLRTRFNANEILVSLMLTYLGLLLLTYLVNGPWRDPMGFNFPQSRLFSPSALFPILMEGTRLNASILITLAVVAAAWVFVSRSFIGFQMQVVGLSGPAAAYAGFGSGQAVWIGMLAGGAAAGLAGVGEVAGPLGQLMPSVSPGYGFTAIIVAFVGRLHPVGIVLAGLLLALLQLGGDAAQIELNLPAAVVGLFQGLLLLFLLSADVLINYRVRWSPSSRSTAEVAGS